MVDHQTHFDRKFYKDNTTGYWISCDYTKDRPRVRAHQWVWINVHGKIPKGYHIHHKNENKSDNRIDNLELIERSRHLSFHTKERMKDPIKKKAVLENIDKIRPLTKAWHASPEGIAWHRLHAIKCQFGNGEYFDYICRECKKPYKSKVTGEESTKFCSNNCKSKNRRSQKIDDVERTCKMCGKIFTCNKYQKTKTCGRDCGSLSRKETQDKKRRSKSL